MNVGPEDEKVVPTRQELLRMARGFSCLFWGMPLTLLLCFRAIDVALIRSLRVPAYLIGVLVIYAGMGLHYYCGHESRAWRRTARSGLFASFLLLYFGPFVYWYASLPRVGWYFTGNLLVLMGSVVLLLWAASKLSSLVGELIGDKELAAEARLCAWSVLVLMFIPAVALTLIGGVMAVRYESSLVSELQGLRLNLPVWVQIFLLLPLSLTMVALWKAKERTLQAVLAAGTGNVGPGDRNA